ncbi:hypothetical protein PITC_083210 [Penicillium italicum]|uniref:Uncharacterized protein n=1 Tax=Penicillium italicum TaxID=40296 RepID=A0A0A2L3Q7_PENIT|nr:hypothetical protein PITC_083210 [Penicillium italicum]
MDSSPERIRDAFGAAAFLAVDAPHITHAGVALMFILPGTYLVCILGISLYSAWMPPWTNQLDAFAMMRCGGTSLISAPADAKPRRGRGPDCGGTGADGGVEGGWVDGVGELGVGELGLGGEIPLRGKKMYCCCAADDMENTAGGESRRPEPSSTPTERGERSERMIRPWERTVE